MIGAADYGVSASEADNFEPLCDAIAAARAVNGYRFGTVQLPHGVLTLGATATDGLRIGQGGAGRPVLLVGAGRGATALHWSSNDLGPGKWAINATPCNFPMIALRDLTLIGPATNVNVLGRPPGEASGGFVGMGGVKVTAGQLQNVEVTRFNHGITLLDSHCKLVDVISGGNYFGVYVDSTSGAIANNGYERCNLTGNTMASVGMSKRNGMIADTLSDCHLGYSPFGIFQVNTLPNVTNPLMLMGSAFTEVAFESCGHAAIYSEDRTGNCSSNVFMACTASGVPDLNFRITDPELATLYRTDYSISVGNWSANRMYGSPDLYLNCAGTIGRVDTKSFTQNECDMMPLSSAWNGGKRFLSPTASLSESAGPSNRFRGGFGQSGTLEMAGAPIVKGQLLQYGGAGGWWRVKPYDRTTAAKCIGVAANDAQIGEHVGVFDQGVATGLPDAAFVNMGNGGPLKPSTTEDGKFTNGTFGTGQIVGFTRNGNTLKLNV